MWCYLIYSNPSETYYSDQFSTPIEITTSVLLLQRSPKRPTTILPANPTCSKPNMGPRRKPWILPRGHSDPESPLRILNLMELFKPLWGFSIQNKYHLLRLPLIFRQQIKNAISTNHKIGCSPWAPLILQALHSSDSRDNTTAKQKFTDRDGLFYISIQTTSARSKQLQRYTQFKRLGIAMDPSARQTQQPRQSSR